MPATPEPLRAILYGAVSKEEQADATKPSLDAQLQSGEQFAHTQGWPIVERIRIEGHSRDYAYLPDLAQHCPEYGRLVALIQRRACDVVICRDYDRLWRRAALQAQLCALADEAGVWLYSLNQPTVRGNEQATMWLQGIYGLAAQQENLSRRSRYRDGIRGRCAKLGLSNAFSTTPYGYRSQGKDKPATVYEPEAHWMRQVFGWRALAWGRYRIRRELLARGEDWPAITIWRRIHNAYYAGYVVYREYKCVNGRRVGGPIIQELYKGGHEAIISEEVWAAVQRINAAGARDYSRPGQGPRLFTGLCRCGHCGDGMTYAHEQRLRCPLLVCARYTRSGGHECLHNAISAQRLRGIIVGEVRAVLSDPEAWIEAQRRRQRNPDREQQLAALEQETADIQRRLERLYDGLESGKLIIDLVQARQEKLLTRQRQCRQQIAELQQSDQRLATLGHQAHDLASALARLDTMEPDHLRPILIALIERIIIRKGQPPEIQFRV